MEVLDTFEDVSGWKAFVSGEARLEIVRGEGPGGHALGLAFDFRGGGGFVVARKRFDLKLPENYSFFFKVRGAGPKNAFEFKLTDEANENVWRCRLEALDPAREWQQMRIRSREIEFAWGPLGGGIPERPAAIELVIVAREGGRGTLWVAELCLRDETYRLIPVARASSTALDFDPQAALSSATEGGWRSEAWDEERWFLVDFLEARECGGLVVQWEEGLEGERIEVRHSMDGVAWSPPAPTTRGAGAKTYVYLPGVTCRYIRLNLFPAKGPRTFGIRALYTKPYEFSRSIEAFFESVARDQPAGLYPRYLLRRQGYWTPVATGWGEGQALINEEGMVEVDGGSFSILPFLYTGGSLVTWADAELSQGLLHGYLPIPYCRWRTESLSLRVTAFAHKTRVGSVLFILYQIENLLREDQAAALFCAILPFQVTPTWQRWRRFGGTSSIGALSVEAGVVRVDPNRSVVPLGARFRFGATDLAHGMAPHYLFRGEFPAKESVVDEFGFASGALRFDLSLEARKVENVCLAVPFGAASDSALASVRTLRWEKELEAAARSWRARLAGIRFFVPPEAGEMTCALKTAVAHILMNRRGPGLQPGPRRYARSWIRDAAVMSAALLRMGHPGPVREFLRWYRKFQSEDGEIPDCVDLEGAEWLPEFDAYGQFIYTVMEYYRFTQDGAFLRELWPNVKRAARYIESLISRRLTPQFHSGEKRACYGLLPESMSHEGYMAHPVHAYWDDFWALRGLRDAAQIAFLVGEPGEGAGLAGEEEELARNLKASLAATMARHGIEFLPGSVELGDFDPSATAVAIALLDELDLLPETQTRTTFERYLEGFRARVAGKLRLANYSAYEIRIVGALLRMGRRNEARELLDFFLSERRIPAWHQWPEISWHDRAAPSFLGDLPHSWIGAEYILAARSFFAYERERDQILVIAAGLPERWLEAGMAVGVKNLPTYYGKLSYSIVLKREDTLHLHLGPGLRVPRGGVLVEWPLSRPIRQLAIDGAEVGDFQSRSFSLRKSPAEAEARF